VQFFGEFQQIYFSNKMIKKLYNKARK
jgi:hypothetical protein